MSQSLPPLTASSLEAFRIPNLPPDFYYIPNFITAEEEASILQKIPTQRWITLSHRRLQAHPSPLTKSNTLLASPLPVYLTNPIIPRFHSLGIFTHTPHATPNHVLINEYKPGQGIMPHQDGDAYAHVVATVSLGGSVCLDVSWKEGEGEREREEEEGIQLPTRILQERRSLLVTRGTAYTGVLHGIDGVEVDEGLGVGVANWGVLSEGVRREGRCVRGVRVSLTYRDVVRVSKAAGKAFGVGRR